MLKSIVAATVIGGWLNSSFWESELRETLRGSLSKFAATSTCRDRCLPACESNHNR